MRHFSAGFLHLFNGIQAFPDFLLFYLPAIPSLGLSPCLISTRALPSEIKFGFFSVCFPKSQSNFFFLFQRFPIKLRSAKKELGAKAESPPVCLVKSIDPGALMNTSTAEPPAEVLC